MRKIAPILLLNVVVTGIVAAIILRYPAYTRIAVLAMPILFVLNFVFFRRLQKKTSEEIAAGKTAPTSPEKMKTAMWMLAFYGAASYISGALNIQELLQGQGFGIRLAWAVKMGMGTLCLWSAYKIRQSLKKQATEAPQQMR